MGKRPNWGEHEGQNEGGDRHSTARGLVPPQRAKSPKAFIQELIDSRASAERPDALDGCFGLPRCRPTAPSTSTCASEVLAC